MTGAVSEAGDAFLLALELFHYRQNEQLQRDIRELLDEFTTSLTATLNIAVCSIPKRSCAGC